MEIMRRQQSSLQDSTCQNIEITHTQKTGRMRRLKVKRHSGVCNVVGAIAVFDVCFVRGVPHISL